MWKDPIVAEVRENRKKLEENHGNDFKALYRDAARLQQQFAGERVAAPPKKVDLPASKT